MMYGQPKGKDHNLTNEGREPKKGLSVTEIQNMMRKMMGRAEPTTGSSQNPLMPMLKGGRKNV